jgi:hypothetical protein
MEFSCGAQLGFVIVKSLSVEASALMTRSGSVSTFRSPFSDIALSTAVMTVCLMRGFDIIP